MQRNVWLSLFLLALVTVQVSTFSYGGCPQKTCFNYCKNGYKRDARGCKTCQCKQFGTDNFQQCPIPNCGFKQCPNGFLKDIRGCRTCLCKPSYQRIMLVPVVCESLKCTNKCPGGRQRDNRGCETCKCKQTGYNNQGMNNMWNQGMNNMGNQGMNTMGNQGMNTMGNQGSFLQSRCPYKPCTLYCPNGYKVDQVGCKICACRTSGNTGGYNQGGYNQGGYNQGGYNQGGYNQGGYNQGGYNQGGYNQGGYNQAGYNMGGYNQGGYNQGGYNQGGYNQGGYNQGGYNQGGYNQGGYNQGGYNMGGFNSGWTTGKNGFLVAPCPPGISKTFCQVSPCLQAKCYRYPYATCVESYCGGCHAAFYVKRKRVFC